MENQQEATEIIIEKNTSIETQTTMSVGKFVLLCLTTFGLYQFWWMYKKWRFFKQKKELDIYPAVRTLIPLLFLSSLFDEIIDFAHEKGYEGNYSSVNLTVGFIVSNILVRLPDPYWLVSFVSIFFFIPPYKALNHALLNSPDLVVHQQNSFSKIQLAIVIIGSMCWMLLVWGFSTEIV